MGKNGWNRNDGKKGQTINKQIKRVVKNPLLVGEWRRKGRVEERYGLEQRKRWKKRDQRGKKKKGKKGGRKVTGVEKKRVKERDRR